MMTLRTILSLGLVFSAAAVAEDWPMWGGTPDRNMVGKDILDIPPKCCLNLHGSLLPKYRGRCPINWVLINGEKQTGVTLHYMTPRPDHGDMVCQRSVDISSEDTA